METGLYKEILAIYHNLRQLLCEQNDSAVLHFVYTSWK